jgi:hypothetical protein
VSAIAEALARAVRGGEKRTTRAHILQTATTVFFEDFFQDFFFFFFLVIITFQLAPPSTLSLLTLSLSKIKPLWHI